MFKSNHRKSKEKNNKESFITDNDANLDILNSSA